MNKTTIRQLLMAVACAISLSTQAMGDTAKTIDVPPGQLIPALKALGAQTGVEFVYSTDQLEGLSTKGVHGELTAENAVAKLLEGTKLTVTMHQSGAVLIAAPQAASSVAKAEPTAWRLAQAETAQNTESSKSDSSADESESSSSVKLEEIIVTAQKREQRLIDVPISIVALGADELQKRQVNTLEDLSFAVPGLAIQNNGGYQRRIMLRGIGNVFGSSSLIGMYLDEASVVTADPRSQLDLRTYDLERIEVLRGPQGTLYGEGSVGGTIRFITKNPVLDRFAMNADVAAQFTEHGEPGQRLEGMLNVPLIENQLGLRIAGTFDRQGGWIDQPAAGRKDYNNQDLAHVRIKGLWQPLPQFAVNAMALIHRNDASFTGGEDPNGNFTQTADLTTTPSVQDDYELYNLTLTYDFPAVRVLSTTSYIEQDKETKATALRFQILAPPAGLWDWHDVLLMQSSKVLTQELRLTSLGSGPWQWTIGGFYRDADLDNDSNSIFSIPGCCAFPLPFQGSEASKSWATFGDMSYEVTDRFTLGTGLRYFEDDRERVDVLPAALFEAATFDSLNPRFYAQYKLTEQVNTYASAAKGFRSGGFNGNLLGDRPPFDPEEVWTYEVGTKIALASGGLSADVALFYSDYTNYQITSAGLDPAQFQFIVRNAGDAKIKGIEAGLTWRPADPWTLSVNGNYVDTELDKINAIVSTHAVGDPLDMIPKYGYTVSAQRDFKWSGRSGFTRLDYNEHGRSTYRNRSIGPWYFSESDIISLLNLNMGLQWSDNLSLGLFAENLLNERGFTDPFSIEQNSSRSRPRTYGIEFGVTFD